MPHMGLWSAEAICLTKACMERRYRMCEEPRGPHQQHYERPREQVATSPKLSAQAACQRSPALCARSQDQQGRDCFSSSTTSTCQSSGEKSSSANARDLRRCLNPGSYVPSPHPYSSYQNTQPWLVLGFPESGTCAPWACGSSSCLPGVSVVLFHLPKSSSPCQSMFF